MEAEKSYYRQKSRIRWIQEGNQNTRLFYKMVIAKQNRNTIRVLVDANGNRLEIFSQISRETLLFF